MIVGPCTISTSFSVFGAAAAAVVLGDLGGFVLLVTNVVRLPSLDALLGDLELPWLLDCDCWLFFTAVKVDGVIEVNDDSIFFYG